MLDAAGVGTMAEGDLAQKTVNRFQEFWDTRMQELKDEERAEHMTPIKGNLYLFWAIKDFAFDAGLFRLSQEPRPGVLVAMWMIPFLQIFTPLCLIVNALSQIHFGRNGKLFGVSAFGAFDDKYAFLGFG